MQLNTEILKDITSGVEDIVLEDGMFSFLRFTAEEEAVIDNMNVKNTAGVQLEFVTDASVLNLCVHTTPTPIRSYFAVDIFADKKLVGSLGNLSDAQAVGDYANKKYPTGELEGGFKLGDGEKTVRIVLPHSVVARIKKLELEGAAYVKPKKREKCLVIYGDSITQGFDALHPTNTYAMRLADALDATVFNKALGGAVFCPELAQAGWRNKADAVIIAFGTNDWAASTREDFTASAHEFISTVCDRFKDSPVYVLSPIWRDGYDAVRKTFKSFFEIGDILQECCREKDRVTFISGWDLVPHDSKYYGDLRLHPRDSGFEEYFKNLADKIKL